MQYLFEVHVLVHLAVKDEEAVAQVATAYVEHPDAGRQKLRQWERLALRERPAEARARVVGAGQIELPERRVRRDVAHPRALNGTTKTQERRIRMNRDVKTGMKRDVKTEMKIEMKNRKLRNKLNEM